MAFSNYQSISEVLEAFSIKYEDAAFVVPTSTSPSALFLSELRFNRPLS